MTVQIGSPVFMVSRVTLSRECLLSCSMRSCALLPGKGRSFSATGKVNRSDKPKTLAL